MLKNGNKDKCGFADEIVSYIYDESGEAERTRFESHLAGCMNCTDEFAAISNARLSVFEWQREEFAPLATPEIHIPYAVRQTVVEDPTGVGLLSGLRNFFLLTFRPVAVAASLAVFVGLGFLVVNYLRVNQTVADKTGDSVPTAQSTSSPAVPVTEPVAPVQKAASPADDVTPYKAERTASVSRKQAASPVRKAANRVPQRNSAQEARKAPVLNNYDDLDDRSLRLADLFQEVGGGI